jgi:hypothetical protein
MPNFGRSRPVVTGRLAGIGQEIGHIALLIGFEEHHLVKKSRA